MIAAISVTPLGAGESVGDLVADCVRIIRESGLPTEPNAMFTNIEGTWEQISEVIGRCMQHVGERAPRVSVVVKLDHRPGQEGGRLEAKRRRVDESPPAPR